MDKQITAIRTHEISAGHRIYGHESKCGFLHGHNYIFTFHVRADKLDTIGRVMDFSVIKSKLCNWLEEHWDHKFLLWEADPLGGNERMGFVDVPFNPTAENMAIYILRAIGPRQLVDSGCTLIRVDLQETSKCSVTVTL